MRPYPLWTPEDYQRQLEHKRREYEREKHEGAVAYAKQCRRLTNALIAEGFTKDEAVRLIAGCSRD